MKGDAKLDNRFVVPHNLALLRKFRAHINVEWCNRSKAIKYLFKYITKGVDKATMIIETSQLQKEQEGGGKHTEEVNEIKNYLECRYLSACEAMWRILAFDIHYRRPAVQRLTLHLPNQHNLIYNDSENLDNILSQEGVERTMFTEWMETNKHCSDARALTYVQFPTKIVLDGRSKTWRKRKQGYSIGRIVNIHPTAGELYFLRLLVNIKKGATSFTDILSVGGIIQPTFKSACYAQGLLDGDSKWHDAMDEAAQWATPSQLRHLFVTLLLYCEIGRPLNLWKHCWRFLADDIPYEQRRTFNFMDSQFTDDELQNYTLMEIESILIQNDRSLADFGDMPMPDKNILNDLTNSLLQEETNFNINEQKEEHSRLIQSLNKEQKIVFDTVMASVRSREGKLFFLYGHGGTGKTYLYKTTITGLRAEQRVVVPVASSGIAALLLPGGRTAHSRFKIPLDVQEHSV